MTDNDKKLLGTFESRLRHLMLLHDELKQENASLKQQLAVKERKLKELEEEIVMKDTEYANLKIARMICSDEDIKETKQKFSGLVREIDKCIALLNE